MGDYKYGPEYRRNAARLKREAPWVCMYCGLAIPDDVPARDPLSWTANHIIPHSKGGTDDLWNLEPMHHACNSKLQDRVIREYKGSKKW